MPHNDYSRAENACRIGLTLTLLAALLNILSLYLTPGNDFIDRLGIVLAVVSLAAGYFAECIFDTEYGSVTHSALAQTCTGACAVSYCVWLLFFAF